MLRVYAFTRVNTRLHLKAYKLSVVEHLELWKHPVNTCKSVMSSGWHRWSALFPINQQRELIDRPQHIRPVKLFIHFTVTWNVCHIGWQGRCNPVEDTDEVRYCGTPVFCTHKLFRFLFLALATFADRGVSRGQRDGSLRSYSHLSRPESLVFLPSRSSFVLTRLSGPRSRPTTSPKIW
jgi:hypothetical protein